VGIASPLIWVETRGSPCAAAVPVLPCAAARQELPFAVAAGLPAVAAGPWCIPFRHLLAFYQSFGFTDAAPPWPAPIARKAAALIAQEQPIAVLALHRRR